MLTKPDLKGIWDLGFGIWDLFFMSSTFENFAQNYA
jgi:hypothetical protein